jgi:hypothetical protein
VLFLGVSRCAVHLHRASTCYGEGTGAQGRSFGRTSYRLWQELVVSVACIHRAAKDDRGCITPDFAYEGHEATLHGERHLLGGVER